METVADIERQRDAIITQIREIRSMERGSITEQYIKVPQKGGKPALRGPYYSILRREGKTTVGYRLTTDADLERAKRDVEAHRRFSALCKEYERLTERLGEFERGVAEVGGKKKPPRSR
jgi:hypothetical protein